MDPLGRMSRAPPEVAALGKDLLDKVKSKKEQIIAEENDGWIDETCDINFWEFKKHNFSTILWFQVLMDNSAWDNLALGLGLNGDEIKWCETFHKHGPTKEIFDRLVLKGELRSLTLGDVLKQVRKLNLKDILSRVNWKERINDYRESVGKANTLKKTMNVGFKYSPEISDSFTLRIHQAPEILVNSAKIGEGFSEEIKSNTKLSKTPNKSKFAAKILMIFASDARKEALKAAQQLKAAQGKRSEIGVMILTPACSPAIAEALLQDSGNSIHKWFKQVDFVVPVLSQQFLRQIQDRDSDVDTLDERQYNRYLYRLTLDDYVANMSKNYKCRATYVPENCDEIRDSEIVKGSGLLQMNWNCTSEEEMEQLGEILISGARDRRRRTRSRV